MQSNNPVFRRSEAFNGASSNAYGNQTYPGNGAAHQTYGQAPAYGEPQYGAPTTTGRPMTIDSVVQKTAISLGVVIVFAAVTWWFTPPITDEETAGTLIGVAGAVSVLRAEVVNRRTSARMMTPSDYSTSNYTPSERRRVR